MRLLAAIVSSFALVGVPAAQAALEPLKRAPGPVGGWVEGELLVTFRSGVGKAEQRRALTSRGFQLRDRIAAFGVRVVGLPA